MFAEFLNIIFKSIKLDKSLDSDNKNFGEASIYFAGLIMILKLYQETHQTFIFFYFFVLCKKQLVEIVIMQ